MITYDDILKLKYSTDAEKTSARDIHFTETGNITNLCKNCGNPIHSKYANYCSHCGMKL